VKEYLLVADEDVEVSEPLVDDSDVVAPPLELVSVAEELVLESVEVEDSEALVEVSDDEVEVLLVLVALDDVEEHI
jgi:hypothetical protein